MTASMLCRAMKPASPAPPPNPPTRNSPLGKRGATVRPAREVMTATPGRRAKASASARASPVPPRIKILSESGTADDRSIAVHDDDLDRGLAVEHGKGLGLRIIGEDLAEGQPLGLAEGKNFAGRIGSPGGGLNVGTRAEAPEPFGQTFAIDLAAGAVKVHGPVRQLAELAETAGDGQTLDRVAAQILERAAGEIAHINQGNVGQLVEALHRRLGGRAGAG